MHRDLTSSFRDRFALPRPARVRPSRRVAVEALEDRRLLAASLDVGGGTLTFQAAGSAMNLSISVDAADVYTFRDPTQAITLGGGAAGWTLSGDGHTATGPASSFTSISVVGDAGAFNDVVSVGSTEAPIAVGTGAGSDSFFFTAPSIAAAVSVDNAATVGSDTVYYAVGGVDGSFATGALGRETFLSAAPGAALISVRSAKPTYASSFPDLAGSDAKLDLDLNSLYTTATALSTTLSVAGGVIQAAVAGGPVHSFLPDSVDGFAIGGTAAGSTLTIDYGGGVPYGPGLDFSPAAGASNTLVLRNGSFDQQAYVASAPGAGRIAFPNRTVGSATITNVVDFANLSPIVDTVAVGGFTFSAPTGAQSIEVEPGPLVGGVQTTRIRSTTNAFEQVDFANKGSVTINTTGAAADVLSVDLGVPAAGLTAVEINTGAGDDTVVLLGSAAGVTTTIDVGAGAANLIDLSDAGSLAGLLGDVYAKATGGATTLKLDDSARNVADAFVISPSRVTGGPIGSFVDYSGGGVTDVEVRGGTANDTFTFAGFGGATTAEGYVVAGGPGTDTLVVNSALPTANISTPGLLSFGAGEPTIEYSSIEQVTLNLATSPPVGIPVTLFAVEARPFVQQTVARFTDAAPAAGVSYLASIDWGDGTAPSGGVVIPAGTTGTYEVVGNHAYAAAATYPVTVVVTRQGGGSSGTTVVGGVPITVNSGASESATIASTAVVRAAPLAAQGFPVSGRATSPLATAAGGVQVASFTDSGTDLPPSGYTALIYWGDGSAPTPATQITATGAPGGVVYNVFGDHVYAAPGNYSITVLITKPPVAVPSPAAPQAGPGAQAVAVSTASILPAAIAGVVGRLDPASDSGASRTDGITNVVQPTYSGMADAPGATVAVVAVSNTTGAPVLLGATQADEAGAWSVTSGVALPDDSYTITVYASDRFNPSILVTSVLPQALTIDTVGPRVTGAAFIPSSGSVQLNYLDYGGAANAGAGVDLASVRDLSNYAFAFVSTTVRGYKPPARWLVGPIAVAPGTTSGVQFTTILINGGTPIRGGVYQILARSSSAAAPSGVQDLAGNALDGEFYGAFPSGNNVNGGDFVARLDSIHNRVFSPQTTVGPGRPRPTPTRPVRPTPVRPVRPVRPAPVRPAPVRPGRPGR